MERTVLDSQALAGQAALVTGAARGIGRAIALRLAEAGADVAVNDLRDPAPVVEEIRARGRRGAALVADISRVGEAQELVRRAAEELGRLDVLVNNAGLVLPHPFDAISEADWDWMFGVNARGTFFCMQAAARVMRAQAGGSIVNVASFAGRGYPTISLPYAASKAAVISLTFQAARVLARDHIRVNAVCPGVIDTEFNREVDDEVGVRGLGLASGEFMRRRVEAVPLGRIGEPADVAEVVAFLASPGAAYVTGQALNIDGGVLPG